MRDAGIARVTSAVTSAQQPWHALDPREALRALAVVPEQGLSVADANSRMVETGPNELAEGQSARWWDILGSQLKETMVIILVAAAAISAIIGDLNDAAVIVAIVVLNVALGFTQELRAARSIEALRQLAIPHVHVRREGQVREISARELVPGDIVFLDAGTVVPADGRVLESSSLRVQEAPLTGESDPVEKVTATLDRLDLAIGDRRNMAYMGKFVRYLLATNSAEIWAMLLYPFVGLPLPLLPLQILWINLVTDELPALALSAELAERYTMNRPPTPSHGEPLRSWAGVACALGGTGDRGAISGNRHLVLDTEHSHLANDDLYDTRVLADGARSGDPFGEGFVFPHRTVDEPAAAWGGCADSAVATRRGLSGPTAIDLSHVRALANRACAQSGVSTVIF